MEEGAVETLVDQTPLNERELALDQFIKENIIDFPSSSDEDSDDDEFRRITNFSEEEAKEILFNQLSYTKIYLDYDLQKELELEIGVNVSAENPWKIVKKELLEEYLTDNTLETETLRRKLSSLERNDTVLVGFYYFREDDDGIFIVYDDLESILIATQLIEKLEICQRFKIKRALQKKPRQLALKKKDLVSKTSSHSVVVEIQTVYPINQSRDVNFTQRLSTDVRDGYMELLPGETEYKNIRRKQIDMTVQSDRLRLTVEQQTDPTFPTNFWTQYLYEITKEEVKEPEPAAVPESSEQEKQGTAEEEELEEEQSIIEPETVEQKPIVVSKQISELIRTLKFNQIDLYRNDYQSIGKVEVPKFQKPYLTEEFCFANIAKTGKRVATSIAWHPKYSGVFVCSYSWSTLATDIPQEKNVDPVNRIVLQPNFVFMWGFDESLDYKLEFESPREVSILSFHPLDPDTMIGGLANGQIIIWDLKGVLEEAEHEEYLTVNQAKSREDMRKFLNWTKHSHKNNIVKRSAISNLELSQNERITQIKWLHSSQYLNITGQLAESTDKTFQYFVTSSIDGTIAFWDLAHLDLIPEEKKPPTKKKQTQEFVVKNQTRFSQYDSKFRPQFMIVLKLPISDFIINDAKFMYGLKTDDRILNLVKRYQYEGKESPFENEKEFTQEDDEEGTFNNELIASTILGDLVLCKWKAVEPDPAVLFSKQDKPNLETLTKIHDGPIVCMVKNPLIPTLFAAVGMQVVSIWMSDYLESPIYWRKRPVSLTSCFWSVNRPSILFITRIDGSVEIWDLLSQTEDPCLEESISGQVLTILSQPNIKLNKDVIAIGDFNSSIRIFSIPQTFTKFSLFEMEHFKLCIDEEVSRKKQLRQWQDEYYEGYKDIIEAKKRLEIETKANEELRLKIQKEDEEFRKRKEAEEQRRSALREKKKLVFDLPERLEKKWNQMNLKRLMQIMIKMQEIDPDELKKKTVPIRQKRAYDSLKKKAIKKNYAQINTDFAKIRSRLLPVEEGKVERQEIVRDIVVKDLMSDRWDFDSFEQDHLHRLKDLKEKPPLTLLQIKQRGRQIREIINKSCCSASFVHRETYDDHKKLRQQGLKSSVSTTSTSMGMRREKSVTFSDLDQKNSPVKMFSSSPSPTNLRNPSGMKFEAKLIDESTTAVDLEDKQVP